VNIVSVPELHALLSLRILYSEMELV
jgi:hypothetical protein